MATTTPPPRASSGTDPGTGTGTAQIHSVIRHTSSGTNHPALGRSNTLKYLGIDECEAKARHLFGQIKDPDGRLSRGTFVDSMIQLQHMSSPWRATRVDLEHLFVGLAKAGIKSSSGTNGVGGLSSISFDEFWAGVRSYRWLRGLVLELQEVPRFEPKAAFDVTQPTNARENYGCDYSTTGNTPDVPPHGALMLSPDPSFSPAATAREELIDQTFHTMDFVAERRAWQDSIINVLVRKMDPQDRPWLIVTTGPHGAGKGYVLNWLNERRILPLEMVVQIDQDLLLHAIPEHKLYLAHGGAKYALDACRAEVRLLQELAEHRALENRQHVWVDSQLWDVQWFAERLQRLRSMYSDYRMCILHVRASEQTVRQRLAFEGRTDLLVEEDLRDSLLDKTARLQQLSQFVDLFVEVDNDKGSRDMPCPPTLVRIENRYPGSDGSLDWSRGLGRHFSSIFEQPDGFPHALASLCLQPTVFDELIRLGVLKLEIPDGYFDPIPAMSSSAQSQQQQMTVEEAFAASQETVLFEADDDGGEGEGGWAGGAGNDEGPAMKRARKALGDAATSLGRVGNNPLHKNATWAGPSSSFSAAVAPSSAIAARAAAAQIQADARAKRSSLARSISEGEDTPAPRRLLITACNPKDYALPQVGEEARLVRAAVEGYEDWQCDSPTNCAPNSLHGILNGVTHWHVAGHADAPLYGSLTIGFVDADGHFNVASQDTVVDMARRESVRLGNGSLEVVMLNGCLSEQLAIRLRDEALIPYVIAWQTRVDDEICPQFAEAFWAELLRCNNVHRAFQTAQLAVETIVELRGSLDGGQIPAKVPRFKVGVDPFDQDLVMWERPEGAEHPVPVLKADVLNGAAYPRRPVGVPCLLEHRSNNVQRGTKAALLEGPAMDTLPATSSLYTDARVCKLLLSGRAGAMRLSPPSPVNLDAVSQRRAGIPDNAFSFCWAYPTVSLADVKAHPSLDVADPTVSLLWVGGYIYFDSETRIVAANAVAGGVTTSTQRLKFAEPEALSWEDAQALSVAGRWQAVTLPEMREVGARYFAWIRPREQLVTRQFPNFGSFAYIFRGRNARDRDPRDRFFPVDKMMD